MGGSGQHGWAPMLQQRPAEAEDTVIGIAGRCRRLFSGLAVLLSCGLFACEPINRRSLLAALCAMLSPCSAASGRRQVKANDPNELSEAA